MPGDRITAVDGRSVSFLHMPQAEYAGRTLPIDIRRAAEGGRDTLMTLSVLAGVDGTLGFNRVPLSDLIPVRTKTYNLFSAIPAGFHRAGTEIGNYVKQIRLMFKPKTKAHESLGGFISIGNIFPSVWNWELFWSITAMLSIMLAVVNILPIPPLDGGHVLFVLYEMVTRRKPGDRFMESVMWVGLILVLLLILYANGNDIVKLFHKS
jgi:regulator of sigma E protease